MQIKKTLKGTDGKDLVYINLSYPDFKSKNNAAKNFYKALAENFSAFAQKKLLPAAEKAQKEENFKPFSAVMNYGIDEDEKNITVSVRVFVFDGRERRDGRVTYQRWDKKTGLLSKK